MAYTAMTYPGQNGGPNRVELCGWLSDDGSGNLSGEGDLVSVSSPGAGRYLITLPGRGSLDYLAITCSVETADARVHAIISAVSESARTVEFTVVDEAGPGARDLASEKVHFRVTLHNSGLPKNTITP